MTPREIAYRLGQQAKALARVAEARQDKGEVQEIVNDILTLKSRVARLEHQHRVGA